MYFFPKDKRSVGKLHQPSMVRVHWNVHHELKASRADVAVEVSSRTTELFVISKFEIVDSSVRLPQIVVAGDSEAIPTYRNG